MDNAASLLEKIEKIDEDGFGHFPATNERLSLIGEILISILNELEKSRKNGDIL